MSLTVNQAAEYLEHHLDRDTWTEADETSRQAALTLAATDVASRLGLDAPDETSSLQCQAVFEQTVFLLRHFDRLNRAGGEIASESLDDAGSRSYRPDPHPGLSPRAMQLIRRLTGGGHRLSRG